MIFVLLWWSGTNWTRNVSEVSLSWKTLWEQGLSFPEHQQELLRGLSRWFHLFATCLGPASTFSEMSPATDLDLVQPWSLWGLRQTPPLAMEEIPPHLFPQMPKFGPALPPPNPTSSHGVHAKWGPWNGHGASYQLPNVSSLGPKPAINFLFPHSDLSKILSDVAMSFLTSATWVVEWIQTITSRRSLYKWEAGDHSDL